MVRNEIELMIPLKGNRKIWSRFRATVVSIEIYFTWPGVFLWTVARNLDLGPKSGPWPEIWTLARNLDTVLIKMYKFLLQA